MALLRKLTCNLRHPMPLRHPAMYTLRLLLLALWLLLSLWLGHFPRKSPIHSGSFAENDLQLIVAISLHCDYCGCGVATIGRLLKIVGLFCKRALLKRRYAAKKPIILRSLLIVASPYCSLHSIRRLLKIIGLFCRISSVL